MAAATVATYPGRGIIWSRVTGSTGTAPVNIQWGGGQAGAVTNSASPNVNLFNPFTEGRVAGTASIITTTALGDTLKVIGTVVCAVGAKTVTEAGLFDALSPVSPTSTLSASLTAGATSMTLGANIGPTTGSYYAQIANETVLVTGANSTTLTIARGQLSSTSTTQAAAMPVTFGGDGGANGWTTGQTVPATSIAASYGGNLFIHSDFAGIALNVNDSVSFTFSDTLT